MEQINTLPHHKNAKNKGGITRRQLLGIASILGTATAAFGAYRGLEKLDSLLSPEEEVSLLRIDQDIYVHNQESPFKFKQPVTYAEFRGTIFKLYPVEAKKDKNGKNPSPSSLIHEAHSLHNPEIRIRGDLADRALDLFSILSQNERKLKSMGIGDKIQSFRFKNAPSPFIRNDETYEVPVYTAYTSLTDIPRNN